MVVFAVAICAGCRDSDRAARGKDDTVDCKDTSKLSEKEVRICACDELEEFLDETLSIHEKASRSVHTTTGEELESFARLRHTFENSDIFLRLPDHLRDYILDHNQAWESCIEQDDKAKCSQARGIRSSVTAMCRQWNE